MEAFWANKQIVSNTMAVKKFKIILGWLLVPLVCAMGLLLLQNLVSQDRSDFPQKPLSRKAINKLADSRYPEERPWQYQYKNDMAKPLRTEVSWPITSVAIEMSPERYKEFQSARILKEQERVWLRCRLSWNNTSAQTSAKIKLHGWTTLGAPKKSFSLKFNNQAPFTADIHLDRFFLINMIHDKGQFHGWFSYAFLRELGLFPNYFQYVAVSVNGQAQGVYLLVERTADALLRTQQGLQFVVRRRTDNLYATKYMRSESVDMSAMDAFIAGANSKSPQSLVQAYDRVLDIDLYLTWLAYNALVQIADTLDELFFYQTADSGDRLSKLKIAAWDYDLLFGPEGQNTNGNISPLFSGVECRFGYAVSQNPFLLSRYRNIMRRLLLATFTDSNIENKLNLIKDKQRQISRYLPVQQREAFLNSGQTHMARFKAKILHRRDELLTHLK